MLKKLFNILFRVFCSGIYSVAFGSTSSALKTELFIQVSEFQHSYSYADARHLLYTDIDLKKDSQGVYFITDQYCEKKITKNVGPNNLPRGSKTNIEHLWPQSLFNPEFDIETQKSDLHHLMIVSSKANHLRGKSDFAEVHTLYERKGRCGKSGLGIMVKTPEHISWNSDDVYQPPKGLRGNIARALFYFSIRYQLPINSTQEYFLRKWHSEDPVDQLEIKRNDKVMQRQGNRNPFIDLPVLVDQIVDF